MSVGTIALIREMAAVNRLWGAERIWGELLKRDIRVAEWTVQQYMRDARPPQRSYQGWSTFLRNHAGEIWACDFLPVPDLLFRPVYAFFVIALGSRRVVYVGETRHPTDAWVAQQLRVAEASGITELQTAYRAPRKTATCEWILGSVRRACLDHVVMLGEPQLKRVLREYVASFNGARPHQGLQQRLPDGTVGSAPQPEIGWRVRASLVLGRLHHTCQCAA